MKNFIQEKLHKLDKICVKKQTAVKIKKKHVYRNPFCPTLKI